MEHMQTITTNIRNGKARPRLENTTPVVRSPGVIVELESTVSGCGKNKQTKKIHKVKVGNLESQISKILSMDTLMGIVNGHIQLPLI